MPILFSEIFGHLWKSLKVEIFGNLWKYILQITFIGSEL